MGDAQDEQQEQEEKQQQQSPPKKEESPVIDAGNTENNNVSNGGAANNTTEDAPEDEQPTAEVTVSDEHKKSPSQENNSSGIYNNKGNEDRKIFVGGIAYDVTNEDLTSHFSQYGEVTQSQVKFDRNTGRSRGFAFVEFATSEFCKLALNQREQNIKNKQCEIKPAKSREVGDIDNKKVFVGGLPADFPEEELRKHFEEFGKVEDIEWPYDKTTKAHRNFAFIVFEEEEAADRAAAVSKQSFGARECDVKKAVPQNKRNNLAFFQSTRGSYGIGGGGGFRGGYGAAAYRGAPSLSMHHNAASQWFNGGWPQMAGVPYATAGTAANSGGWGDWYNNAAANYYAQTAAGSNATSFGAFGTNGYDYAGQHAQSGAMSRQQQANGSAHLGAAATHQRYQQQF
jgi:RNA recognition motif-containing protein